MLFCLLIFSFKLSIFAPKRGGIQLPVEGFYLRFRGLVMTDCTSYRGPRSKSWIQTFPRVCTWWKARLSWSPPPPPASSSPCWGACCCPIICPCPPWWRWVLFRCMEKNKVWSAPWCSGPRGTTKNHWARRMNTTVDTQLCLCVCVRVYSCAHELFRHKGCSLWACSSLYRNVELQSSWCRW